MTDDKTLQLPSLYDIRDLESKSFTHGSIDDLVRLDDPSLSSETESLASIGIIDDDVWSFPQHDERDEGFAKFRSWETFYDKSFREPRTVYISEAGSRVFDALLVAEQGALRNGVTHRAGRVISSDPLTTSLWQLGLGRESAFYHYSEDKQSFLPVIEDGRISGYSLEAFQSLSSTLIDTGNKFKYLHRFIEKTQTSDISSVTLVALAAAISDVLISLEVLLNDQSTSNCSLLQLQSLFERPTLVLKFLFELIENVHDIKLDERLLSILYEKAQDTDHAASWLRSLTLRILATVSKPWLESVSGWLGLRFATTPLSQGHSPVPNFASLEEDTHKVDGGSKGMVPEYEFRPLSMPSFIAKEDAVLIFETGKSLQLLKLHQPEHPLVSLSKVNAAQGPSLEWCSLWGDVERIQAKAKAYHANLQKTIIEFNVCGRTSSTPRNPSKAIELDDEVGSIGLSEDEAWAYITSSIRNFEMPLSRPHFGDKSLLSEGILSTQSHETFVEETFAPPTVLLPILSFSPVISTQAELINKACLRLLIQENDLRSHLSLLYRFNLFGDGVFASRLSHALFDPELQSAERRKGHSRAGTSGLKLGSRETWPPASSEIRLVLMGILTESYGNTNPSKAASSMFGDELPGGLSFSIRDMSEDELRRCMNPDSIEALDFLKLDYRPPSPLDAVITSGSVAKYDAIFKLLLRSSRMLFVANQLFRDAKSKLRKCRVVDSVSELFRIQSHHFISAICSYFCDGVRANWAQLEEKLEDVEKGLDGDNADSVSDLREFHEQVLDRMMFALILRQRQRQVMQLLEEIFSLVLRFARYIRLHGAPSSGSGDLVVEEDVKGIYAKFHKKVRVFVNVCRGLNERRGQVGTRFMETHGASSQDEDQGNTIGHLLLRLNTNGFYATEQR